MFRDFNTVYLSDDFNLAMLPGRSKLEATPVSLAKASKICDMANNVISTIKSKGMTKVVSELLNTYVVVNKAPFKLYYFNCVLVLQLASKAPKGALTKSVVEKIGYSLWLVYHD